MIIDPYSFGSACFAWDFDGLDDRIDLGGDSSLKPTTEITVSIKVNFTTAANGVRFFSDWHQNTTKDRFIFAIIPASTVKFYIWTSAPALEFASSGLLSTGVDYHFLGTYDGANVKLYQDGVLVGTKVLTGTMNAGSAADTVQIGKQTVPSAGGYFNGVANSAFIADRAFDASEALDVFQSTDSQILSTYSADIVGFWNGTNSTNVAGGVLDQSTNSNDGTMVNMTDDDIVPCS